MKPMQTAPLVATAWSRFGARIKAILTILCLLAFRASAMAQPVATPPPLTNATAATSSVSAQPTQVIAAAPNATQSSLPKDAPRLTFGPTYLPKEVELTKEQVASISAVVVRQVTAYHESLVAQNIMAAAKQELWLPDFKLSQANDQWQRLHTQEVLTNQHRYSKVIFWTVLGLVFAAVLLTVYQFIKDSALAERAANSLLRSETDSHGSPVKPPEGQPSGATAQLAAVAAAAAAAVPAGDSKAVELAVFNALRSQTTLTLGPAGLQLGSQLVGLAILAFALGFFYLYLEKVYPVTIASSTNSVSAAVPQK